MLTETTELPELTESSELTSRLAHDVDAVFAEVVAGYGDRLYSTALRLTRSADDAEDLAQVALVNAYRALRTYDRRRIEQLQLRAWLWTILLNLVRNRARTRSRKPPSVELDPAAPIHEGRDIASDATTRLVLADALATLRPIEREVLVLHYVADLPYDEISIVLGRPVGTLKSHAHRSLSRLRKLLGEER